MDFQLNEEQQMVAKMVRDFANKEVAPTIKEWDQKQEMDPNTLPRMAELGILGVSLPVRYGGQGMDYISLGLVCEELEAVDTSIRVVMSVHMGLCSYAILQWGTEEQKMAYLPLLASGENIGGYALTEPDAGSDPAALVSTARRDGDDYIINGEKMWISLSTRADLMIWIARTDPEAGKRTAGMSAFILETNRPGVTSGDIHGKLGVRAGSTGWINCQDVRVPASSMLGEEGEGFKIAMSCLDNGRYTVAAGATGLIRASLEASVRYAKERVTFGVPIANHQLIQQKLAYMARDYEAARLLYLKAGWRKNQGLRNTRETGLAKWYATDASFNAASEAVQIHGAYGYSDEYEVERYMRNGRGAVIYEGSSEIQQLLQAGYVLGTREDAPLRKELPPYDPDEWTREA